MSVSPLLAERGFFIQSIYERIRQDILRQRFHPGVKLVPDHLAASLEVSRTPVRQALERLCQEGYVLRIPARGYFVAEPPGSDVHDLYDVRYALEVRAMESAFDKGFAMAEIDALDAIHERYRALIEHPSTASRSRVDQEYHLALAKLAGNAVLVEMLRNVYDRLSFRRRSDGYWYWADRGLRGAAGVREHQEVLRGLRVGDREAALTALRSHLSEAQANYEQFLGSAAEQENDRMHGITRLPGAPGESP
jgi:DNA-binding GntR family transcriptional regulator